MKKMYFKNEDSEMAHPIKTLLEEAKEEGLTEITVCEAVISTDKEYFFCRAAGEVCQINMYCVPCGKECEDYEPCNGKSGRCKHKGKIYDWGEEKTFKVK
ncbi:MAG: hypothetical protein NTZ33_14370 [Bacteroidetes bacterium]|nr:hypothetical protein [Bacteroidota bacterium]